jgi:hypothetical protein
MKYWWPGLQCCRSYVAGTAALLSQAPNREARQRGKVEVERSTIKIILTFCPTLMTDRRTSRRNAIEPDPPRDQPQTHHR